MALLLRGRENCPVCRISKYKFSRKPQQFSLLYLIWISCYDTTPVLNSLKLSFTFLQSDILCRVIIPADSPLRVGTHLEFERLMPEGANFAHGTHQRSFWLPAHIIRLVKASMVFFKPIYIWEILICNTYGNSRIHPPHSHSPCGSRTPISESVSIM